MEKSNIPKYNFKKIEKKWRDKWEKEKTNQLDLDKAKKPFYNLMMFPYPSAEGLHIGGVYTFTGVDTFGRLKRMQGYDVFEPIGLDGFGIHSENYAMKIGEHIKKVSDRTEKNFYRQLSLIGNMYDWSRTVETYKPEYYKWTQWLFLKMYKKGLAYQKKAKVNWCPSCKTVLSDEQVIQGECERCDSVVEKKELKQWFFKITEYADKLLKNLKWIDWPKDIKQNQKNWIGKSEGAKIKFEIKSKKNKGSNLLKVFTTRPDTIFGATYMVIAPEHNLIKDCESEITNYEDVSKYVSKSLGKSEQERKEDEKEKTGIEIKGIKAINPATGKETPVWVADYVLGDYGTGAIMAVPAHDERDFEFAKKYNLEIKQVVSPMFKASKKHELICRKDKKTVERNVVYGIVKDVKNNKILMIDWLDFPGKSFVCGGIKKDENIIDAAKREIAEETGYANLKFIKKSKFEIRANYYALHKDENRYSIIHWVYFELEDDRTKKIKKEDNGKHNIFWVKENDVEREIVYSNIGYAWQSLLRGEKVFTGDGVVVNSDFLDGLGTKEAKKKIIKWLEENEIGEGSVDYKLRDWCVSRQRYWGPPIPIVHCEKCGTVPVPEKDLPVLLPEMDDFLPEGKGKGPLAKNEKFVRVKCPKCGGEAKRETDVSDPFVDSSWYFLRYPSTEFNDKVFDEERTKKWLPVDSYIGGKEHTVLHLLYSRFVTMVLNDLGFVDFDEPYKKFIGHGLITKDGAKMSKSKGNVINPDEMIEKYGVDTTRIYLRFLGDFYQGGDWSDSGVAGMAKFINRLWNTFYVLNDNGEGVDNLKMLDKTIKAVEEDLEKLSFNTAVARIMELVNWINENKKEFNKEQSRQIKRILTLIIAPFVPHLAEEFWQETQTDVGANKRWSVFNQSWPKYNPENIVDNEIELAIQINGKLRATIKAKKNVSEKDAIKMAKKEENVQKHLDDKEIKKAIFVPGRLVNFVV